MKEKLIVYYDSTCGLCCRSVNFIIRHDPDAQFLFASLQSPEGQKALKEAGAHFRKGVEPDSIILSENGHFFFESEAALRIASRLDGGWNWLRFFSIIPLSLRNQMYRFVARNREKVFESDKECMFPTPELRRRFLS